MAGTIIADFIRTDANQLSLNVGNTTFATINASGFFSNTGTQIIAANGQISGASVIASSITNAKLSLSANDSNIKTALNASGDPGIYACRAWVNFNGTSTVAIRGSGNVSSITDNGTGDYTVNFTNAMPDANYAYTADGREDESGALVWGALVTPARVAQTTTTFRIISETPNSGSSYDYNSVTLMVFR
jgi:hypothetical protein